jgi:hypothetical protein
MVDFSETFIQLPKVRCHECIVTWKPQSRDEWPVILDEGLQANGVGVV